MSSLLRVSVRFLQPLAHGRRDGGEPEWPPSPLRLFQALVAAAAAKWNERMYLEYAAPALRWLEQQPYPEIRSANGTPSKNPYRLYVPDNVSDKVAKAWSARRQGNIADFRTEKDVRPTHLANEAVHYLYPIPDDRTECAGHLEVLKTAARSITHLGWGIDMVAAECAEITQDDADRLPGHRWRTVPTGGVPLRVPKPGTLDDLIRKHADFLGRLSKDGFKPVPPLSCFDVVGYHSPTVVGLPTPSRPLAAFEIHRTIEDQEKEENAGKSRFRPFHHVRRVATVAGMVRNAAANVARRIDWPPEDVQRRIEGHGDGDNGQATSNDRLLFLPLPSITRVGVSGIRRVLIVGPPGFDLAPLRRRLNGQELLDVDSQRPVAMLSGLATTDRYVKENFLNPARTWSTVTPVILPGFDDPARLRARRGTRVTAQGRQNQLARVNDRTIALIWKGFHQAGWTPDALAGAEVEYRAVGWFPGLDLAKNYDLPPLRYPRFHLRIRFRQAVAGPIAVGAGRYRGMGLFAREE